jgi:hypothetical protein
LLSRLKALPSSGSNSDAAGRIEQNGSLSSTIQTSLSSALFAATELAHSRVSKIIATRNEQHAKLKLQEFYVFYEESWGFVVDCEVVCKRMVVGLRGTIGGQVSTSLKRVILTDVPVEMPSPRASCKRSMPTD